MDPNEILAALRRARRLYYEAATAGDRWSMERTATCMADLVSMMDDALSQGGRLPQAWATQRQQFLPRRHRPGGRRGRRDR